LDKETAPFCKELWKLLLSAQGNPQGVPKELLEAKKLELMQEKVGAFYSQDLILLQLDLTAI
jgi:serine/arginine repetitive matrix protein 1